MNKRHLLRSSFLTALLAGSAIASNLSFQGNFTQDDDIVLLQFVVPATQDVTIFTLSYAGGTNAAGQPIPAGGFDTILSLFDSTGLLIGLNDDGDASVPADPITGNHWDAYLFLPSLAPDIYTLAITEADNSPFGPTLADGFLRAGSGNFSGGFVDLSGSQRQPYWAADVIGDVAVPTREPSELVLMLSGAVSLAASVVLRNRARGEGLSACGLQPRA